MGVFGYHWTAPILICICLFILFSKNWEFFTYNWPSWKQQLLFKNSFVFGFDKLCYNCMLLGRAAVSNFVSFWFPIVFDIYLSFPLLQALTPPLPLYPPNAGPVIPSILTSAAFSTTPIVPSTTDSDLVITGCEHLNSRNINISLRGKVWR